MSILNPLNTQESQHQFKLNPTSSQGLGQLHYTFFFKTLISTILLSKIILTFSVSLNIIMYSEADEISIAIDSLINILSVLYFRNIKIKLRIHLKL